MLNHQANLLHHPFGDFSPSSAQKKTVNRSMSKYSINKTLSRPIIQPMIFETENEDAQIISQQPDLQVYPNSNNSLHSNSDSLNITNKHINFLSH